MRTGVKVAALSLAVLLGACDKRQEQATGLSEDLKRDLAAASAVGDFATAPRAYEPTRVVSAVEMAARTKARAPRLVASKRRTASVRRLEAVKKPAAEVVAEPTVASNEAMALEPAPVAVATETAPEAIVIVQQPTPETAPAPIPVSTGPADDGRSVGEGGIGERRPGGGIGGIFGAIGGVIIRGGIGGVDKCDPRTDGRRGRGGVIARRPDFGMPSPVGRPTFPSL